MKKIFSFLLCCIMIFGCSLSTFAAEEDNDVQTVEEGSQTSQYNVVVDWPDSPIAVYEVANPYRIETVAMLGDVYQGTISDLILKYLTGFVEPFKDYLIYRSGQYTYVVIVGNDFRVSGSVVSGSGIVSTLTTVSDYNNTRYTLDQSERDFSVNTGGSAYVYSNIDSYSDCLKEVRYEAFTTFGINAAFIFIAVRDVFKSIFR